MIAITVMSDIDYMRMALELARRGAGWVAPNPQVGCVIVKDGKVIGQGWHHVCGDLHAERDALRDCTERGFSAKGATVYVTLEPCCHTGKQPPCTAALIEAGVSRVCMGAPDPNPLVAGKGIAQLEAARIPVDQGIALEECMAINREWFFFIENSRPFVTMKFAMTLDGKISTCTGDSKWVTGTAARKHVHENRAKAAGIMVGIGTVLTDDPLLTARIEGGNVHSPARFVLDAQAQTPLESQLVLTAFEHDTYIITEPDAPASRSEALRDAGCKIIRVPAQDGKLDLHEVMKELGKRGIDSLIVEGGAKVHGSLLASGLANRVQAYIAPKLIGGQKAPGPIGGAGIPLMSFAQPLEEVSVTQLGEDLLVQGYLPQNQEPQEA